MKVRTGFVTNSSSSSFIIAIQGGISNLDRIVEVENVVWKKFIVDGITSLMESDGSGDTAAAQVMLATMKDLDKLLEEEGDYLEAKDKKQYVSWLSDGWVIYRKNVDYNDTGTKNMLRAINCDAIKVIYHAD